MNSKDILITGAGPSGLSMAIFLSDLGYQPRIIDRKERISDYSKALAINPRSLELFESSGISKRFMDNGNKMSAINIYKKHKHIFRNDLSKVNHRYPFMLIQQQKESEEILLDEVMKREIKVEYDTTLLKYEIDNNKVASTIQYKDGEKKVYSDLIIGADGGHSVVREQSGISYTGYRYDEEWEIADVELETYLNPKEGHILLFPEGGMIMIPFKNNIWRLAGSLQNVQNYLPPQTKIEKTIWKSVFRIHHKVVDSLISDSVALIGDAAHLHSPVGARGMNMGIEDAFLLSNLIKENRMSSFDSIRLPYLRKTVNRINDLTIGLAGLGSRQKMIRKNIGIISIIFPIIMPVVRKFIMGLNK